jgi:DNA-binding transcriptional ArsR family regulator
MDSHCERAGSPDLAGLAGLLADGTRASFCLALLDGRAWTAAELARHAGVAAPTATGHLNLLVAGGLLTQERQGRHRYVRLASADVAALIENLAAMSPPRQAAPRSLAVASRHQALARARTCYDHLAGALGVRITEAMTQRDLLDLDRGLALTDEGARWFAALGITLPPATRRPLVRSCLDWTERRPHLAGAAGAALCVHAMNRRWITRIGTGRAVALTEAGRDALYAHLGLAIDERPELAQSGLARGAPM